MLHKALCTAARSAHRTWAIDSEAKGYFPAQTLTYLFPFLFAQITKSLPHRSNLATDSTSHRASSRSSNCTPHRPTQSPRKVTQLVSDNHILEQSLKTLKADNFFSGRPAQTATQGVASEVPLAGGASLCDQEQEQGNKSHLSFSFFLQGNGSILYLVRQRKINPPY